MADHRTGPYHVAYIWESRITGLIECDEQLVRICVKRMHWYPPHVHYRVEDMRDNEIVETTFDLRDHTEFANRKWPKREALIRYLAKKKQRVLALKAKRKASVLPKLRTKEKAWLRKLKLAQTKLKKVRAAIKRYEKKQKKSNTGLA